MLTTGLPRLALTLLVQQNLLLPCLAGLKSTKCPALTQDDVQNYIVQKKHCQTNVALFTVQQGTVLSDCRIASLKPQHKSDFCRHEPEPKLCLFFSSGNYWRLKKSQAFQENQERLTFCPVLSQHMYIKSQFSLLLNYSSLVISQLLLFGPSIILSYVVLVCPGIVLS